jgi:hypothetical protein
MVHIFRDLRLPSWRMHAWRASIWRCFATIGLLVLLSACESEYFNADPASESDYTKGDTPVQGSILGGDSGNFLFGPSGLTKIQPSDGGVGVNAYLWRATLDTMSIWPVASADPFGGVIITDWYAPPATPNERFKLNIYILGRALRADGVRVAVFRQLRAVSGDWRNAVSQPQTAIQIENAILTRARQFRNRLVP